jgi:predicted Zn-dependent peptidase
MKEGGIIEAYLETENAKSRLAQEALQEVLAGLFAEGVEESELEITKIMARASFLRENEAKTNKAASVGSFEALGLGYDYPARLFSEIGAVTLEEMNSYIREVLAPEKAFLTLVGPGLSKSE